MFLVPKPSGNPGFVLTILNIIIRRNRMTIIKVEAHNCRQFTIKYFQKFSLFSVGEQRWKKRQTLQTCLCYFSQLVLIFRPRAQKTMHEECFTHCIISTRALNTSAITISINNAFFMLFSDLSQFYWSFELFCYEFFGANIFGPLLYLCYFNRFFHLCRGSCLTIFQGWQVFSLSYNGGRQGGCSVILAEPRYQWDNIQSGSPTYFGN